MDEILKEFTFAVKIGLIALCLAAITYLKNIPLKELKEKLSYTEGKSPVLQIRILSGVLILLSCIPFLIFLQIFIKILGHDYNQLLFLIVSSLLLVLSSILLGLHIKVDFKRILSVKLKSAEFIITMDESALQILGEAKISDELKSLLAKINQVKIVKTAKRKFSILEKKKIVEKISLDIGGHRKDIPISSETYDLLKKSAADNTKLTYEGKIDKVITITKSDKQ